MDSEPVALQPELARDLSNHFRDWNEGHFRLNWFKADYVISWMLANISARRSRRQ
ncbi:hypothetical protein RBI21_06870 [Klebsiella pneumoniae]|nr:hypothetical protein RBI21_06870 [Klebsiella pneumoniae]